MPTERVIGLIGVLLLSAVFFYFIFKNLRQLEEWSEQSKVWLRNRWPLALGASGFVFLVIGMSGYSARGLDDLDRFLAIAGAAALAVAVVKYLQDVR